MSAIMKPVVTDERGCCVHCGRDSRGHENEPCVDECPAYWEEMGIPHPEYPAGAANHSPSYSDTHKAEMQRIRACFEGAM